MIIDFCAFIGNWPTYPVSGDPEVVQDTLSNYGVSQILVSSLESAWCRNPHRCNDLVYRAAETLADIWPVPILDPTIATWQSALHQARTFVPELHPQKRVHLVRLLPTYSPYDLSQADELLKSLVEAKLGVIIQTRLEDPRRQHPLAQVPDLPAEEVAAVAEQYPALKVIIGGTRTGEIRNLQRQLMDQPNLYADISQVDGLDVIKVLVNDGLVDKLLFGSHIPIFTPHAAIARVVCDLDDGTPNAAAAISKIFSGNAGRILD